MVGMSLVREESHHHGGLIPSVHTRTTIPEKGVETGCVLDVKLTVDPGPGARTPVGMSNIKERSPSMINGNKEWFRDVSSMVGRWEEMEKDETEWLPGDGKRRGGKRISRKITELINEFQDREGGGGRDTDSQSDILSFDSICNIYSTTNSRKNNNSNSNSKSTFSSKLYTHIVSSGVSVMEACDWSGNNKLLTNKNDRKRKRKSEREMDIVSQETKKRRPGQ